MTNENFMWHNVAVDELESLLARWCKGDGLGDFPDRLPFLEALHFVARELLKKETEKFNREKNTRRMAFCDATGAHVRIAEENTP